MQNKKQKPADLDEDEQYVKETEVEWEGDDCLAIDDSESDDCDWNDDEDDDDMDAHDYFGTGYDEDDEW